MCKIIFQEEKDFHAGALILVDKPLHWTSFDVVNNSLVFESVLWEDKGGACWNVGSFGYWVGGCVYG